MNFQIISTRAEFQELLETAVQSAFDKAAIFVPNSKNEQPINTKELCSFLDITEPTLIRWRAKGKIPFLRIGSRILYQKGAVLAALENKKGLKNG
jgi:excisionase family DNA binding protein